MGDRRALLDATRQCRERRGGAGSRYTGSKGRGCGEGAEEYAMWMANGVRSSRTDWKNLGRKTRSSAVAVSGESFVPAQLG